MRRVSIPRMSRGATVLGPPVWGKAARAVSISTSATDVEQVLGFP
jgi:hypothetical protein